MDPSVMVGLILLGIVAGILGSLFGVGGGIIYIPVLTIVFGLSATEAAAISLIGIIATSAGASAYYAEKGVANVRIGLYLELGTAVGAIAGAFLAAYIQDWILMVIFSLFLFVNAGRMILSKGRDCETKDPESAEFTYTDLKTGEIHGYDLEHKTAGTALCVIAGAYSSMTGVGGGVIKVPVMNNLMGVPMKAATATSSYMIGITAFSGAVVYLITGSVLLDYAAFVAIGSFVGMIVGTRISRIFDTASMKKYFSIVLIASSISMLLKAGGIL